MPKTRSHSQTIDITSENEGTPTLNIKTFGNRGRITTSASVTYVSESDTTKSESFLMFSDYTKTINTTKVKRCTQKLVDQCHAQAMNQLDEIQTDALAHYAAAQS